MLTTRPFKRLQEARALGRRLARRTRELGGTARNVGIRDRGADRPKHRATIARRGDGLRVLLDVERVSKDGGLRQVTLDRLPAVLALVSRADPLLEPIEVDFSDGEESGPGIVAFCSAHPDAILVPDHEFCHSRGYRQFRQPGFDPSTSWASRSNTVLWRGSSTGLDGRVSTDSMEPVGLVTRVRMCLLLRGVPGVNVKIADAVQVGDRARDSERLSAAGIFGERIDPVAWVGCRLAIDIDGNTNAWSNLFTRLLLGNCVIKIASARGYRQWYYDRLRPGAHFVPVRADMADLVETIEWCRGHPAECLAIARSGRELALSMTYERETAAAIERLNAHARRGAPAG